MAWETRRRAERLVFVRLTAALTDVQREQLDGLLVVQPGARMTTLAALRQPPRRPTPATFVALAERLQTIRAIGLNVDGARQLPSLTDEAIELHDRLIGQYRTQTRSSHP